MSAAPMAVRGKQHTHTRTQTDMKQDITQGDVALGAPGGPRPITHLGTGLSNDTSIGQQGWREGRPGCVQHANPQTAASNHPRASRFKARSQAPHFSCSPWPNALKEGRKEARTCLKMGGGACLYCLGVCKGEWVTLFHGVVFAL